MSIEHKMEPVEHWIVDGKAYRLATEGDVGKEVYRSDLSFEDAIINATMELESVDPYFTTVEWKYAYIQDDSLLTPQRTPVPALGDGWFLLTTEDEFKPGDKITADGSGATGWIEKSSEHTYTLRSWLLGTCLAARYFGPAKIELQDDTEIEPGPIAEANSIDWTKPVRTKDGRAVRVLCTDGPNTTYPVCGYIDGERNPRSWTLDGYFHINERHSTLDLENAPRRIQREYWANVYEEVDVLYCYSTRHEANENAGKRFACVKITIDCEEGEGL